MRPFALFGALILTGCLYRGAGRTIDDQQLGDDTQAVRVLVPIVVQEGAKDCGAAALVAILDFWSDPVTQQQIRHELGIPAGQAIAAGTLQKYLVQRGYDSFLISGTFDDLWGELHKGRPVLVGLLKPYLGNRYLAHYEVVTAISPKHVYTMNPEGSLERYPIAGFDQEWRGAHRLTLLVAPAAPSTVQPSTMQTSGSFSKVQPGSGL
jgi:ABC-type bacteriocin/lantibiotic exporter with double-glycine peptidase domain